MRLKFSKFSATGNDFIVIDNRNKITSPDNHTMWNRLCARKTGIGADGVLLLENSKKYDFKMRYLNSDGYESEMCGNGARAISYFAKTLSITSQKPNQYSFETMNSSYLAEIYKEHVKLKMTELSEIRLVDLEIFNEFERSIYMNTGVPHSVFQVNSIDDFDVLGKGRDIRYHQCFKNGCNVNFFAVTGERTLAIRTYERGVEDETLACGTGATATAIAASMFFNWKDKIQITTLGGQLEIIFDDKFENVFLCGEVSELFTGFVNV